MVVLFICMYLLIYLCIMYSHTSWSLKTVAWGFSLRHWLNLARAEPRAESQPAFTPPSEGLLALKRGRWTESFKEWKKNNICAVLPGSKKSNVKDPYPITAVVTTWVEALVLFCCCVFRRALWWWWWPFCRVNDDSVCGENSLWFLMNEQVI